MYKLPEFLSVECRDLIGRILRKLPEERLSLGEIKGHAWLVRMLG